MHTRHQLRAADFRYHGTAASLAELLPGHTPNDRVVFVTPDPGAGLADLTGLILALAHAFYDRPETAASDFYDYPSHFVIGGTPGAEPRLLHTAASEPWSEAWCEVDVWPNTHHAVADPSAFSLLQAVYMLEPNVLVWPANLALPTHYAPPENAVNPDQSDMEGLLSRRLRQVLLHDATATDDTPGATRIELQDRNAALARRALACLPQAPPHDRLAGARYRPLPVTDFLHAEYSTNH
jgi:hypothetical protein